MELASDLSVITSNKPLLWYLNTPETEANFVVIDRALTELGYVGSKFPINEAPYTSARFGLWCFERSGTGACSRAATDRQTRVSRQIKAQGNMWLFTQAGSILGRSWLDTIGGRCCQLRSDISSYLRLAGTSDAAAEQADQLARDMQY
jgi:hypothetical protein